MPEDTTDVTILIAIGRIEEKVDNVQRGQERLEGKFDAQDARLTTVERDITELKTQRENKSNTIALIVSVVAVLVAAISLLQ